MIILGQPRELRSVRKPKVFDKVYVVQRLEVPLVGVIQAGEVGIITAVYGEDEMQEIQVDFGREFEVRFDLISLHKYTRPFKWVKLSTRPGREVATIYRWSR